VHSFARARTPRVLGTALAACLVAAPSGAHARPNIERHGGQWGIMLGGSACIPGARPCTDDGSIRGGIAVSGATKPSFGTSAELGYRIKPYLFFGAAYHFGLFNPDYSFSDGSDYRQGYQHSVYAIVKPILPAWRFDFGLGLGPGFSRQTFRDHDERKDYSQGFSWAFAPSIDIFVSRRIFLGVKADILLNAHGDVCQVRGDTTTCSRDNPAELGPIHQALFGFHLGGTFL